MTSVASGLAALRRSIDGSVVAADSPDYDQLRTPPVPQLRDVRPRAIVRCRSTSDIVAAVGFARRSCEPVAVRSGGHSFTGMSSTTGVLVDVSPMNAVTPVGEHVTVGAGARLGDVYDVLHAHGRTLAAGCGPTVGIAGLTLGGGLGLLGRRYGLTCDQLVAAEVVLPDGRVLWCDEQHEPDLFWALRGGGAGRLGVVTALRLRTVPEPAVTTFHLTWPVTDAAAAVEAWLRWAPDGPDELAASLVLTGGPDTPPVANVFGTMQGGESHTRDLLADLVGRVGAAPGSSDHASEPYRAAKTRLARLGDGLGTAAHGPDAERRPARHKSEYFSRIPPTDAVRALVEHLQDRPAGVGCELDLTPWGGAYNRVPVDATAFVHRTDRFLIKYSASTRPAASPGEHATARQWLTEAWQVLRPFGTGRGYQNFPDADLDDPAAAHYGTNRDRLARVTAAYDPARVFDAALLTPAWRLVGPADQEPGR